jgi:type III restriction enzyme
MMVEGIEYERTGDHWEMHRLEPEAGSELERYFDKLYQMQIEDGHPLKSPYSAIEFQSDVERRFAESLDREERVRFFLKLPAWFQVETPIGPYNPDWAIMRTDVDDIDRLYLVCETKGTTDHYELRGSEGDKIRCGIKHFETIGVRFTTANAVSQALM